MGMKRKFALRKDDSEEELGQMLMQEAGIRQPTRWKREWNTNDKSIQSMKLKSGTPIIDKS